MASALPTPSDAQLRVSDLGELSLPIQWHEAVAVVRAAARVATGTRHGGPLPAHTWLHADGTVSLDPHHSTEGLTPALASMLGELLPSSSPGDLLLLGDSRNAEVRGSKPEEFIEALTFFARPDDSEEIRRLFERAMEARAAGERQAALQALTDRARHAGPAHDPAVVATRKPLPWRRLAVVVLALCVAAGAAAGAWWVGTRVAATPVAEASPDEAPQSPARRVQQSLASAAAFVSEALTGVPERPAGRGADVKLPARRTARAGRTPEKADVAPVVAAPSEERVIEPQQVPPPQELPSGNEVAAGIGMAPVGVFSAANPDVLPPAMLRPQMPEAPIAGLPIERPGHLELLVDERGQVVTARLVPASNRHQDRMMVSAAKTWRFQPATWNGQAVTYRLQLPITW